MAFSVSRMAGLDEQSTAPVGNVLARDIRSAKREKENKTGPVQRPFMRAAENNNSASLWQRSSSSPRQSCPCPNLDRGTQTRAFPDWLFVGLFLICWVH